MAKFFDHPAVIFAALIAFGTALFLDQSRGVQARDLEPRPAPAFTQSEAEDWIESAPLTWKDLRGKVVLMDVWTFGCWNCYRSFPWLNDLHARYADQGLEVIGIHSPEFAHEKDRDAVVKKMQEFGLEHPVMLDNDFAYWRALNNRFWPAFYLVDKQGQMRFLFTGETHKDDEQARVIEQRIQALLAAPAV